MGTWALPFSAYLALLSGRIVAHRLRNETSLGDKLSETTDEPDALTIDSRTHGNFLENVPLAFALGTIAELNGADRKYLNYAMAALFVSRILHCEVGLRSKGAMGLGRPVGYYGTQAFLAGVAAWSTYLIKGYWGY